MFFSINSAVGFKLQRAMAPSRALWSLLRFEKRIGGLLWASLFLLLGANSEHLKAELFPVYSDIPLDKARGAALGLRAVEVVLLVDCFGSLSS